MEGKEMLKIYLKVENTDTKAGTVVNFACLTAADGNAARSAVETVIYGAVDQMEQAEKKNKEV